MKIGIVSPEYFEDLLLKITGVDLSRCPCCHEGIMITVGELSATPNLRYWDSS